MIKIKLDDKTIEIPSEMTIRKYTQMRKFMDVYKEDKALMLATFLGVSPDELKDLQKKKVEFIAAYITTQYAQPKGMELPLTFEFKGVKYGLENDWYNMAWGAWVDLEVFATDIYNNIHNVMAVLYRPVTWQKGEKYEIEPYKSKSVKERAEIFQDLPVKYWISVSGFFLLISSKYIETIKSSLMLKSKLNRMVTTGLGLLPRWARPKRLPDFTFNSLIPWRKKT